MAYQKNYTLYRRLKIWFNTCIVCCLISFIENAAQSAVPATKIGEARLVDRIVAVVEQQPITLTEIKEATWLKMAYQEGEVCLKTDSIYDLLESMRQNYIQETLLMHAARRTGDVFEHQLELKNMFAHLKNQLKNDTQYNQFLNKSGLDERKIQAHFKRWLLAEFFLETRLHINQDFSKEDLQQYRSQHKEARLLFDDEIKKKLKSEQYRMHTETYLKDLQKNAEIRLIGKMEHD